MLRLLIYTCLLCLYILETSMLPYGAYFLRRSHRTMVFGSWSSRGAIGFALDCTLPRFVHFVHSLVRNDLHAVWFMEAFHPKHHVLAVLDMTHYLRHDLHSLSSVSPYTTI
jgi:hypothetical protein